MIFLTTGEKIRSLRKKFGMRQQELEDENITRAFISMIETGKRGLSKDTAENIAQKLNKKAESLGLTLNIDGAYLTRTPAEDAEAYCFQKLNNEPTKDEIDVIIDIAKKHKLTKVEAQAYKTLGDYDYEGNDFGKAFINYMISLDLYKDTDEKSYIPYLYNRLGACKSEQLEYVEAHSFFSRANYYAGLYNDIKIETYSLYNIASVFKKLKKYDDALEYIENYLKKCDKKQEFKGYVYASVVKANCYRYNKSVDKALSICNSIMGELNEEDSELLWYVYNNIGAIYLDENNFDESLEWFDKSQKIAEDKYKEKLSWTCIQRAGAYIRKGVLDEALKLSNRGMKLAVEANDTLTIIEAYYKLIDIYTALGDFISLKNSYIKLIEVLKNKDTYMNEVIRIYNKLALLYLEQNDIEMCKKYLHMAS